MAVIIPQVVTASRATGAQVIDGSLKFDSSKKNYLTRTPGSAGNNKTFTFSTWTKGLGDGTFSCNGVASTATTDFILHYLAVFMLAHGLLVGSGILIPIVFS